MKKIICLLLAVFGGLTANPVFPGFMFSEFQFDEQYNWKLEIHACYYGILNSIDSVEICTNTDKSVVLNSVFTNSRTDYYEIQNTPQFLSKPLSINSSKDTISIVTHYKETYMPTDTITFAFGTGSSYPITPQDMSIANFFYPTGNNQGNTLGIGYNPTPSFGTANDSTGVSGVIHGKFMDKNGTPLKNTEFHLHGMPSNYVMTDSNGNYRQRTLSKRMYLNSIQDHYWVSYNLITPVDVLVMPDSTSHCDFILDMTGINEQPATTKSSALLYNYPNPFNNQTAIYYEVPEGVKYKNATIRISNIKGEAVAVLAANQKSGSVYWNADHNSAGMYIYQLLIDGKAVKSGEMVLLK